MNLEVIKIRMSKLLELYPYLYSRALTFSDLDALNTVLDIDIAVQRANLTETELAILNLIYFEGWTQNETAEGLNLTRNKVRYRVDNILNSVGRAYYYPERYSYKRK